MELFGFDEAVRRLKNGARVSRKGWNGPGQYVTLGFNFTFDTQDQKGVVAHHEDSLGEALVFYGTRGIQVGWLASQSDMLSCDWYEVTD